MQGKFLIVMIPFLGLASASSMVGFGPTPFNFTCDDCLSIKVVKSDQHKTDAKNFCQIIISALIPFAELRNDACNNLVERYWNNIDQVDMSTNCYAIGVCPEPASIRDQKGSDEVENDCYVCANLVTTIVNSLSGKLMSTNNNSPLVALHQMIWPNLFAGLRRLLGKDELNYLEAFANSKLDFDRNAYAYCYSINMCKQIPSQF